MDSNTTYTKTARGLRALVKKLPRDAGYVLSAIHGSLTAEELLAQLSDINEQDFEFSIKWLLEGGFIKAIVKDPFPNSMWDVSNGGAMQVDEIGIDQFTVSEKLPGTVTPPTKPKKKLSADDELKIKALKQADTEAHQRAEAALKAKVQAENGGLTITQKNNTQQARFEAEAKAIAEKHAKKEVEEKAAEKKRKHDLQEKEKREAEAKAEEERKAEEAKAKALAEEKAKKEAAAEKKAQEKAAEEKRKRDLQEKEKREAEAKAEEERKAEEAKAKALAEEKAKKEAAAEKKAQEKAAEEKRKRDLQEKEKREAEAKAEEERKAEEAKAKALAEEKAKKEAEEKKQLEVEKKALEKAAAKEQVRLEAAARKEDKLRIKAERKAKVKEAAEKKAEEKAIAKEQARLDAEEEKSLLAEEEIEQYLTDYEDEKITRKKGSLISSIKKGLSTLVKSVKPLSIYAVAVLFLLIIAAQFINFHIWIHPIERIAKQNIQDNVSIKSIRVSYFPSPHLLLEGLTIADSKTLTAKKIRVYPNLLSLKEKLLGSSKAPYEIKSILIEDFKIAQKDLTRIASWQGASSRDQQLRINKLSVTNMSILLNKVELPSFNGDILLDAAGLMKEGTFTTENNNFTAVVNRSNNQYLIDIEAIRWRAPISPYPVFTKFIARATVHNDLLAFSKINGTFYNGTLDGSLNIDLASEILASKGQFTLNDFYLADMAEELKLTTAVDGKLKATGQFSFNINKPLNSIDNGQLTSTFSIKNGFLKTVDLTEAMRSGNLSGYTKFTSLAGKASLSNKTYRFSDLLLRHNQLSAKGSLTLSPDHYVTGAISSRIAVKRNPINARLNINGPLTAMKLKK